MVASFGAGAAPAAGSLGIRGALALRTLKTYLFSVEVIDTAKGGFNIYNGNGTFVDYLNVSVGVGSAGMFGLGRAIRSGVGLHRSLKTVNQLDNLVGPVSTTSSRAAARILDPIVDHIDDAGRVHLKILTNGCFVAGTLVKTDSGQRVIESLRAGERVITALAGEEQATETAVTSDWSRVRLTHPHPQLAHVSYEMELLRDPDWMEKTGAAVGSKVPIHFEEIGVDGEATVLSVEPVGELASGSGRVVLSTITHVNQSVREVHLSSGEVLQPTAIHQLYSITADDWVKVKDLQPGDVLRTHDGKTEVVKIVDSPAEQVYNIEVETQHWYFVGKTEVQSHNTQECQAAAKLAGKNLSEGVWKEIARNDGDALDLQMAFSGKGIQYRNGKAYIEEYYLGGVYFDRFKDGILGEVKGDYGFAARVGKYNPNLDAITDISDEARRQISVSRKFGLPIEWFVRKQDQFFFEDVLRDYLDDITVIGY